MDDYKRNGQIPPFGNWEYANDLPITQYFECARQAGLLRYSSSSGDSGDLYTPEFKKYSPAVAHPRKARGRGKRSVHVKEHRKQGKVCDVTEPPRRQKKHLQAKNQPYKVDDAYDYQAAYPNKTKAVDEDLYKISPKLLQKSKRSKMKGFFSRCLVPSCAA